MFHEAMLTSGVSEPRSWLIFQGVDQFGPRWPDPRIAPECQIVERASDTKQCPKRLAKPQVTTASVNKRKLEAFIKQNEARADRKDLEILRGVAQSLP
jgi:hypothetical protein